jgi:hypothetical protein
MGIFIIFFISCEQPAAKSDTEKVFIDLVTATPTESEQITLITVPPAQLIFLTGHWEIRTIQLRIRYPMKQ